MCVLPLGLHGLLQGGNSFFAFNNVSIKQVVKREAAKFITEYRRLEIGTYFGVHGFKFRSGRELSSLTSSLT